MICIENTDNKIHVFGRKDRKPYHETISFTPYFYIKHPDGKYKSIFGDSLKKITCKLPSDIPKLREGLLHMEADVLFLNKFLIDNYKGTIPKEEIRKMYIDIEINSEDGMPSIAEAPAEIQSIAVYDNFLRKYNVFILSNGTPKFELPPHNLFFYDNEQELILKFVEYIKATDPDMFIAYFGDQFDFPYIINRMKTLRLNYNQLSRINKCYTTKDKWLNGFKNTCKGRILFDMMYGYKHISQGERANWKLDYIANYELGIGKTKYEGSLANLYKDNLKLFIEYNIRDVELMVMLDDKLHIVDFFDTMRRYARCHFSDVFKASKLVDSLLLKHARMRNVILPSKNFKNERRILGAFVQDIKPGLYRDIAVLDWAGLYPNIIRTLNLSPEVMTEDVFGDVIRVKNKHMKKTLYFKKDVEGLIPELVRTLIEERKVFKKLMREAKTEEEHHAYDILQYAVKVAANSVFGVIKDKCRLSNIDIAEAITTMGYYIIKKSSEIAEKYGYKVIYCDSVVGNTEIMVDGKRMTIESFWNMLRYEPNTDRIDKEEKNIEKYGFMSLGIKEGKQNIIHKYMVKKKIKRIIRHKVNKKLYKIKTESGKFVIVTEDHSIPIRRNGKNILISPTKIQKNDKLFTYVKVGQKKGCNLRYIHKKIKNKKGSKNSNMKNKLITKNYFENNDVYNKGMKPKEWMSPEAYDKWVKEKSFNNPIFRKMGLFKEKTKEEKYANNILEPLGFQYNKPFGTGKGGATIWKTVRFVPDFCNEKRKIIIEIDGKWHNNIKERDKVKDSFFIEKGYDVHRIKNKEVKEKLEELICQLNLRE